MQQSESFEKFAMCGGDMCLLNNILALDQIFSSLWLIFEHTEQVVVMRQELCCLWLPVISDNLSQFD